MLTVATTVLAGFVVTGTGAAPAGAAPLGVTLTMLEGGGALTLRGGEPRALATPTTLTATQDDATGLIVGGTFATPDVEVEQYLEDLDLTAYVDAKFVQLGDVTGSVDHLGHVIVRASLRVDLHVEIEDPAILVGDCSSSPVNLVLEGSYSTMTQSVALADADFTIPQFGETDTCTDPIKKGINDLLAGSGHAIAIRFDGHLELADPPGDPTVTVLGVTPGSGAGVGDDVTLTATVTNTPEPGDTPTGNVVEFLDGSTVIDVADLVNGTATLVTHALQAGNRSLRARYLGVPGQYDGSTSSAVAYAVGAPSLVTGTGPEALSIGGDPVEYDVVVRNPGPGTSRTQRADLTIRRFGVSNNPLDPSNLLVEVEQPGGTWAPVTLTGIPADDLDRRAGVIGSLDPNAGVALAAGASRTITVRISTVTAPIPGPVRLSVVMAAPADPVEAAPQPNTIPNMWSRDIDMVPADRWQPTIEPGFLGFAWGIPQARAGGQAYVMGYVTDPDPTLVDAAFTGRVRAFLDGKPVLVSLGSRLRTDPFALSSTLDSGNADLRIAIPAETAPGEHTVIMTYSGDAFRKPATSAAIPLSIAPATGRTFECVMTYALEQSIYRINIDASARIPSIVEAGQTGTVDDLVLNLRNNRDLIINNLFNTFGTSGTVHEFGTSTTVLGATATLTDGSSASFATAQYTHFDPNYFGPPEPENPDAIITLAGGDHGFAVPETPGETVSVGVEHVQIELFEPNFNLPIDIVCDAVDENLELADVTVGDVDLTVAPSVVVAGQDVNLAATVVPATATGAVVFKEGGTALTYAPVVEGLASATLSSLPVGVHQLTAEFVPADATPGMTSDPVAVTVVPAASSDVESFVVAALWDYTGVVSQADFDAGVAALEGGRSKASFLGELSLTDEYLTHVVNEMYLDTLGRVGDPAGVAFWVGRLRSGYSVARVAASFYGSDEYFGRVGGTDEAWVEDLYGVLLGRGSDAAGLAYWVGQIPVRGRGGVALAFFQTPESARARVASLYGEFLGRSPNQADAGFWAARVIAQGDLVLAVNLTVSDEYQNRAESRFPSSPA